MTPDSPTSDPGDPLQDRINYLEKANRWYLFALDLATSMVHLHGRRSYTRDPIDLLNDAQAFLKRLMVDYRLSAFFVVDEADSDFILQSCEPPTAHAQANALFNQLVDNGDFAWALNQNRTVVTRLRDEYDNPVLLHVLASKSRARGMFLGILDASDDEIFDTISRLISIICHNAAYSLESAALYQLLDDLNHNLELRVREGIFKIQEQNHQLAQQVEALRESRGRIEAINAQLREELYQHAQTTRRLAVSEERFRSITQATSDAIIASDEMGQVTFWNRGAEQAFGLSEQEAMGRPLTTLMPVRYRENHRAGMARLRATGQSSHMGRRLEVHGLRRNSEEFPIELSLGQWTSEGRFFFAAVIRDISERRATEDKQLREQQARQSIASLLRIVLRPAPLVEQLEQVLDHLLTVPWIRLQARAMISLYEPGAHRLVMAVQRDLPAALLSQCSHIDEGACLCGLAIQQKKILFGSAHDSRHANSYPGMEPHAHYCVPILSQGYPLGLLCLYLPPEHREDAQEMEFLEAVADTLAELIERNRMDESLRRAKEAADTANRAKSTFLASVSHDIRTPLHTILGMGELLADSHLTPDQQSYVQAFRWAGEALLALINDVLDLSKIEANQLVLETVPFDLLELVATSLEILQWQAGAKGLSLTKRWDPAVPLQVVGDPERLRQILLNLVGNAIKFTPSGDIVLSVRLQEAGHVTFSVRDSGIGIPSQHLQDIFQPFVQLGASNNGLRSKGTGLGLAICRRLVGLMGGEIWVESAPGKGSTFHFSVPLLASERFETRPASHPPFPETGAFAPDYPEQAAPLQTSAPIRILVAEDAPEGRILLKAFLAKTTGQVTMVSNGQQAVEKFRQEPFDLVIMDMQMPVMDGYEATRQIRAHERAINRPLVPIVALTAHAMKVELQRTLEAGCTLHITKPIKSAVLLEMIGRLSGSRS